LAYVLGETAKIIAPFCPFLAETLWQKLGGKKIAQSVHLCVWPQPAKIKSLDKKLMEQMALIRDFASVGLQIRQTSGIKIRQPLNILEVPKSLGTGIKNKEFWEILKDELNIKQIQIVNQFSKKGDWKIGELGKLRANLDINITQELYQESIMNDLVRGLQDLRQKAGLKPGEPIVLSLQTKSEEIEKILRANEEVIKKAVKAKDLFFDTVLKNCSISEIETGEMIVLASLKKI
jgi:valyl-tRNA synthetase